jgi:hypothetical protein
MILRAGRGLWYLCISLTIFLDSQKGILQYGYERLAESVVRLSFRNDSATPLGNMYPAVAYL